MVESTVAQIKFFGEKNKNGYMSNFFGRQLKPDFQLMIDGHNWSTTEHYF